MNLPDGISHVLTNLSAPQVASTLPSGLKQTPNTVSLCPDLISTAVLPVATSKTLISPSSVGAPPPTASSLLSGENDSVTTLAAKPPAVCFGTPVAASQIFTSW